MIRIISIPGIIGAILAALVVVSWITGTFANVFPVITTEVLICIIIIAVALPLMTTYEIRKSYVNKIEKQLPEFLREMICVISA